ncbi:MAG: hypothetical protein HY761_03825 [Candidatus Omnitrophica bacterium]|nr:hypothetical protein [Candidatus Omnitrophota bacterium]
MKTKIIVLFLIILNICSGALYALEISGMQIMIIAGASLKKQSIEQGSSARIVTYEVDKPLDEVISFYEAFLNGDSFSVIRGRQNNIFDASVKKNNVMFSLRIYPDVSKPRSSDRGRSPSGFRPDKAKEQETSDLGPRVLHSNAGKTMIQFIW